MNYVLVATSCFKLPFLFIFYMEHWLALPNHLQDPKYPLHVHKHKYMDVFIYIP